MGFSHGSHKERIQAVKSYLSGETVASISRLLGRHPTTVYDWIRTYSKKKKFEDLLDKPRSGRPKKVTSQMIKKIESSLSKPASEFGHETDLWTCNRVHQLLTSTFGLDISRGHIWLILRQAGFSYQKPERRYYESDPVAQEEWLKKELPKIKKKALKHRAILYFEDEASVSLTPVLGKTWAKKGQTPLVKSTGNRGSLAALSAISTSGHLVFNLKRGRINSDDVIDFLGQMLDQHKRRHLVVVMDRAATHTSKKVRNFIGSQKRLHVFYLPPRSPNLNPDEKVWNHLKHHDLKGHKETTLDGLERLSNEKLSALSSDPRKVRGIFLRSEIGKLL